MGAAAWSVGHLCAPRTSARRLHHHHAACAAAVSAGYAYGAGQAASGGIGAAVGAVLFEEGHSGGVSQQRALRRQYPGRGRREPGVFREVRRPAEPARGADAGGDPAGSVAPARRPPRPGRHRGGTASCRRAQPAVPALAAQVSGGRQVARGLPHAAGVAHHRAVAVRGAACGRSVDCRRERAGRAAAVAGAQHHRPRPAAIAGTTGARLRAAHGRCGRAQRQRHAGRYPQHGRQGAGGFGRLFQQGHPRSGQRHAGIAFPRIHPETLHLRTGAGSGRAGAANRVARCAQFVRAVHAGKFRRTFPWAGDGHPGADPQPQHSGGVGRCTVA